MARIDVPMGDNPEVIIENISGILQVKGWDEEQVRVEVPKQEQIHHQATSDRLTLSSDGDCILRVPEDCTLKVKTVSGDAYIGHITGTLEIGSIGGSLTLKALGEVQLGKIHGTLTVRAIEGDISVEEVYGNAALREVEGELHINSVHANLSLREVEGYIEARSDGNAELRLDELENDVDIKAGGNLFCYLDEETDAEVSLESGAQQIQVSTGENKQSLQTKKHVFTLGDGGTNIYLKAGGHIDFRSEGGSSDADFDLDLDFLDEVDDMADEISEQVGAQVEGQLQSLNERLEGLQERLRASGERAARVAQRRVEAAQRKLQHKLHGPYGRIFASTQAIKQAEPVSDQERSLILQMLQDKKIDVQEAEMLLNTLEGRAPAAEPPASESKPSEGEKGE